MQNKGNKRLIAVMMVQEMIFSGDYNKITAKIDNKNEDCVVITLSKNDDHKMIELDSCEFNLLISVLCGDNNILQRDMMVMTFNNLIEIINEDN